MNQIVYNRLTLRCNSNRDNLQASIDSMLESVDIAQASQRMVAMHEQAELKKHVNRNSKRDIETQHILLVHHIMQCCVHMCTHSRRCHLQCKSECVWRSLHMSELSGVLKIILATGESNCLQPTYTTLQ